MSHLHQEQCEAGVTKEERARIERAAFCQRQAAMRMESYWIYRNRGEAEGSRTDLMSAMRFHAQACDFYREARSLRPNRLRGWPPHYG